MYEHPMIQATLRNARESTRVVARNIISDQYTAVDRDGVPDVELAAQWIANAVVDDFRGSSALNDRHILNDRFASPDARREAGDRQDLRVAVGTVLMTLANTDTIGWRRFVDRLAAVEPAGVPIHR